MVPIFPDWQNSTIFPWFFQVYLVNFQVFFFTFKCDFQVVFNINLQTYQVSFEPKLPIFNYTPAGNFFLKNNLKLYTGASKSGCQGWMFSSHPDFQVSYDFSMIFIKIFKIPWFFQVFQVEWESWIYNYCKRTCTSCTDTTLHNSSSDSTLMTRDDSSPWKRYW